MDKSAKLFWRYFGPALVVTEIAIYLLLIQNPFPRQIVSVLFLLINMRIIVYLVQVKLAVEKHNAQINAAPAPKKLPRRTLFGPYFNRNGRAISSSRF